MDIYSKQASDMVPFFRMALMGLFIMVVGGKGREVGRRCDVGGWVGAWCSGAWINMRAFFFLKWESVCVI